MKLSSKVICNTRQTTLARTLAVLSAASALALPGMAQAQAGSLEEIVVTAQQLTGNIQDIPIAISTYSEAQLESLSINRLSDITRFTPGLTATPGPNGGNEGLFYIRGIGQNDGNAATDPGVGTYLDGVYMGRTSGASLDTMDIQQVEVLRGPQGTLFGRNTIGGAINVTTKKPDTEALAGQVKAGVMERNGYKVQSSVNVPLGQDWAMRFAGLHTEQDGWGDSVYTDDTYGDVDTTGGRVKLLWNASDELQFLLEADGTRARGTSLPTILTAFDGSPSLPHRGATPLAAPFPFDMGSEMSKDEDKIFSSIDPKNDMDVWGTALHIDWDLGRAQLSSITAYRNLNSYTTQDFDGGGYAVYDNFMDQDQDQTSQELLLKGNAFDDRLEWLVGLYYYEESIDYTNAINLGTNINLQPFQWAKLDGRGLRNNQRFHLDVESEAVFTNLRYKLTDAVALTLGARYNYEKKKQNYDFFVDNRQGIFSFIPAPFPGNPPWPSPGYVQLFAPGVITPTLSPDNPFLPPDVPTKYDEDWDKVTPRAVVDWQLDDELMFYASYAEGFKSGGWNGRPQDTFASVPTYQPEEVNTYEVGMKSEWLDRKVRLNTSYFFSDYTDIQLLVLNPATGFFETANAAEAELQGIELDITAVLVENLQATVTGTWTDSKYTKLSTAAQIAGIDKDDEFPLTPEYTASAILEYTFDMGNAGSIVAHADYSWQDHVYYGAANGEYEGQDSYGLTNLRLSWISANDKWTVAGYVLNAADEDYYSNGQDVVNGLGVAFAGVGRPREYGMDFIYSF